MAQGNGLDANALTPDAELFRDIVEHLQDAIFIHAEDGRILYVNQRMLEMHGLPDFDTVRRMNVPEHFSALPQPELAVREVVERMWRDGKTVFEWVTRRYPSGEPLDIELMLHPLVDRQGRRLLFAQARALSARKKAEAEIRAQRDRAERALQELRETQAALEKLALTDPLTGLGNRRKYFNDAHACFMGFKRHRRPLSVLLFDIDDFKAINDRYGHLAGDRAIEAVAKCIRYSLRDIDSCARIGGEEFAVILPDTDTADAGTVAERIRVAVEDHPVSADDGSAIDISVSAGVTTALADDQGYEDLMRRADKALYSAKAENKNCVRVFLER
jgi:diguanylate cyclase (GGDEF)-like protein/PAS domain S-box-containing protein